jgi:hypothetical protein
MSWVPEMPDLTIPLPSFSYDSSILTNKVVEAETKVGEAFRAVRNASENVLHRKLTLDMSKITLENAKLSVEKCEVALIQARNIETTARIASTAAGNELERLTQDCFVD